VAATDIIARLGGWQGYELVKASEERRGERLWCVVALTPVRSVRRRCSHCGGEASSIHDCEERCIRDLPIFEVPVELVVPRLRVLCPRCGPRLEHLDWLEPYARVTTRLAASVARLCKVMSIRHVAAFYGLAWDTVKEIDRRHLERELGPIDLSGVEIIAMDEFAIQKGHRYATVVVEPLRKRVLWVGRGRGREDVRPFFDLLGEDGCQGLKAVAMDMSAAYGEELRARCPNAQVVYDLFHVIAKYGREVIDRVRVDEANRLRGDRPARRSLPARHKPDRGHQ
jgi:transposase